MTEEEREELLKYLKYNRSIGADYSITDKDADEIIKVLEQEPTAKNDLAHNLCDSCTNVGCVFQSGIVRTKCAFYIPPHIEPDNCGNYVVMQPTAEVIPKDQYEARLKAERKKISEDVANKMNYMGSCLNEKNIILGIITGKRETLDSLCSICKSENCISNGTAISKVDYGNRLKADMIAILGKIRAEIEQLPITDTAVRLVTEILDKYKAESDGMRDEA